MLECCLNRFMLYRATFLTCNVSVFILTKLSPDLPRFPIRSDQARAVTGLIVDDVSVSEPSHAPLVTACVCVHSSPSKPTSLPALYYRSIILVPLALREYSVPHPSHSDGQITDQILVRNHHVC